MRVVITGGGTGGHIYPAVAIARGLVARRPETEILYIGSAASLEADLVPREGLAFAAVHSQALPRRLSPGAFLALWRVALGTMEARRILRRIRPQVVVGTGGYVCGPVVLAAEQMGIPVVLHEQNALPGFANRLLAKGAYAVCITFREAEAWFRTSTRLVYTGLPVRAEVVSATREEGAQRTGLDTQKTTILVVGGSRGARSINRAAVPLLARWWQKPGLQLVHLTGHTGYQEAAAMAQAVGIGLDNSGNVRIVPYAYRMQDFLATADLVVSRAGATFLAEVMARGLPAILVPYPYAAENHQEQNARALVRAGAALSIPDSRLTAETLGRAVEELLVDPERMRVMGQRARQLGQPDALERIIDVVLAAANV